MQEIKLREEYQVEHVDQIIEAISSKRKVLGQLPTGGGKCLGWGTPVLMYSGYFKPVQEVCQGDLLMGIDSTPRTVLSTCRGNDEMYKITPLKGDSFICNAPHILSLKCNLTEGKKWVKGRTYNISVQDYLELPNSAKHILKLYKSEQLEFDEKEVSIDPYVFGIWLGDGSSNQATITNMNEEVLCAWYKYAADNGFKVRVEENKGSPARIHHMTSNFDRDGLTGKLRKLGVIKNKHIPKEYLFNTSDIRMQVLAGIIDTDGYLHHNGYEIHSIHEGLIEDIQYLCRSLGFAVSVTEKKGVKGKRITFYGSGLEKIPVRIEYKKANKREQIKDALRTQFTVEHIGRGQYYGFELDSDRLFIITKDFIVTHNTVEFAFITQRFIRGYIRDNEAAVLILVHREELMNQAAEAIRNILGLEPYLITSETKKFKISRVYIGMVESTLPRLNMIHNVGLVIIDECHIANFNKVHSVFLEELILGFSATPISSSKKDPLNNYYHAIVTGPQISELIKMGYLSQNITRCPKDVVDATKFEIDKLKGDYKESIMANEYRLPKFVMNVIANYWRFCNKEKTMVFNVNIEHSKEVAACFVHCGIDARHLDASATKEERRAIFKWFKETEDAVLCSVMIPTVGFDEPTVKNIILNFATLSLTKFMQCCGRGGRIIDEDFIERFRNVYPYLLQEKYYFNIIDLGANYVRFGDWNDDRDWDWIFNHPDLPSNGLAPVKTCPQCEGLLHAATMICTMKNEDGEICGYEFERRKTAQEQDLEEMILVTKGIDIASLVDKNRKKYEYYTFLEMAFPVVRDMYLQYPEPSKTVLDLYFKIYYKLCIAWYEKTLAGKNGNILDITDCPVHLKRAKNNFDKLVEVHKPKKQKFNLNKLNKEVLTELNAIPT